MKKQEKLVFKKIADAIVFLSDNYKNQPSLDEVAKKVSMSPFHFQRLFTKWTGVSPKKFIKYLSISDAKKALKFSQTTLFDAADNVGLSGTGRLHDLFITMEGMSPGAYKKGGENLHIHYSFGTGIFGSYLVASTDKGICYLTFSENDNESSKELFQHFPNAKFYHSSEIVHKAVHSIFQNQWEKIEKIHLHVIGSTFQIKVWEALLEIPCGKLSTYGKVADSIGQTNASRAVGTAVGKNPVAYLIPCHRVIKATGMIGNYHWGSDKKRAMLSWEAARKDV